MKRDNTNLLFENWRAFINESNDDDDIYAPIENKSDDVSGGDELDDALDYVESQARNYRENDEEKASLLARFQKMFNKSDEEMDLFLADQAFDSGFDNEGNEFDTSMVPDDMPSDMYNDVDES